MYVSMCMFKFCFKENWFKDPDFFCVKLRASSTLFMLFEKTKQQKTKETKKYFNCNTVELNFDFSLQSTYVR